MIRAQFSMIVRLCLTIILVSIGDENFQTTQKFIEDGGPSKNADIAEKLQPYIRLGMILFTVGRVILFLVSLRYKRVSKTFIYYEIILDILQALSPQDVGPFHALLFVVLLGMIDFMCNYFDWWPSLIKVYIALGVHWGGQALFVEEHGISFLSCALVTGWFGLTLLGIHLVVTKVGMIYVETEVLKNGNEKLLNTLTEGVIIFRGDRKDVIFTNTKAKRLQENLMSSQGSDLYSNGKRKSGISFDKNKKLFAKIDTTIFK